MDRDSWLSNVELRGCDEIPCRVHIAPAVWAEHRQRLAEVLDRYPEVEAGRPGAEEWGRFGPRHTRGEAFQDAWGCLWENVQDGIVGQVTRPPLADWNALAGYRPPSPAETGHFGPIDWDRERRLIESGRLEGVLIRGAVDHGFFFQRLYYLRGFEGLMIDIATGDPRLDELCAMLLAFNRGTVERYLKLGVDVMHFGDDLGMQERLTISPEAWRRYIKPAYAELFGLCRRAGAHVHLHSDGYIADIMPDLIECGVTILNPQDLCNGLERIRAELRGRICIDLDVDRQSVIPWRSPEEIEEHVRNCIRTLGSPQGGLMLVCGVYPPTPLQNIEAVFRAMGRHRRMFAA